MPKDTFFNLSHDKQRRIFEAAVQEFSTRRFSEASLNQIVKAAKIPWGSFYQYFNDKEDIYLYMLKEIDQEKREILNSSEEVDPEADFFATLIRRTRNSLGLGRIKPEYTRIGMLMEVDNSEFISRLRADSIEGLRSKLKDDKERGLIKPEVDTDLVADLIFTYTLEEYFRSGSDEDRYLKKLGDVIKIIKEGIAGV